MLLPWRDSHTQVDITEDVKMLGNNVNCQTLQLTVSCDCVWHCKCEFQQDDN